MIVQKYNGALIKRCVECAVQKEETDAQKKKQAEAEEAQKKLADLIVEAQSKMEKEKAGGAAESSESTTQEEKIAEADEHIAEEEQPQVCFSGNPCLACNVRAACHLSHN